MAVAEAVQVRELVVEGEGGPILGPATFTVEPGELVLVTGPSGAGKTTLLRALMGSAVRVYGLTVKGSISIGGCSPLDTRCVASKAFYIPQEPWYAISTPYVAYELAMHSELPLRETLKLLEKLGLEGKALEATVWLSAGETQRLLYLEALASRKPVILVDEVSAYLDDDNRRALVSSTAKAARDGAAVIVVDHNVELWRGIASKTIYIESGRLRVYDDPLETPVYPALLELRRRLASLKPRSPPGEVLLEAETVWFRYPDARDYQVKGVSLRVARGEIVWVRGRSGGGKTTLLKLLAGVYKPSRGRIRRRGSVQLIPENPLLYLSEPTPREELGGRIDAARLVGLEDKLDTPIARLSSGERRRLSIASAYARGSDILLVDEPTVGLDPWNAVRVLKLLAELASKGVGVVVATHSSDVGGLASKTVTV